MKALFRLLGRCLTGLIGSLSWQAPPWLAVVNLQRREKPGRFYLRLLLALLVIGAVVGGGFYYAQLPQPLQVVARADGPGIMANDDLATPDPLVIDFVYDDQQRSSQPIPDGYPSVARIDLVDQPLEQGIRLTPPLRGQWQWRGDATLAFTPEEPWPAGTKMTVEFDASIFSAETRLAERRVTFTTPTLTVTPVSMTFYQDPQQSSVRRVATTLRFSCPVDEQSLREHIRLGMRPSGASAQTALQPVDYELSFDKRQREAYLHSVPLALPDETNTMQLQVLAGVTPATGGAASTEDVAAKVVIPDRYSYLKVTQARSQIVRNDQQEPQQVITLEFTDDIDRAELLAKLQVFVLPNANNRYWSGPRQVTAAVLKEAQPLTLEMIDNPRPASKLYNFVIDVEQDCQLYLRIGEGLTSVNDFVHSSFYDTLLRAPDYPQELSIMGEGAMLSRSGAHQLSLLARGLQAVKVEVGKLLPHQINHLVSQSRGDIKDGYFSNYNFDENNITALSEQVLPLQKLHPARANYAAVDLSSYLPDRQDQFGLFFVTVTGWDPVNKRQLGHIRDRRVILVTDLGLLVKDQADDSHLLFVQSIRSGKPVAGAKVRLLGRNGVPLFERTTGTDGKVSFPSTKGFDESQQPTAYVVESGGDLSFIPFARYQRQLNYSSFNVGGVRSNQHRRDNLNAFVFTDRGIYRPGETAHLGFIVKDNQLGNVEGMPLEVAVRSPRGNEVWSQRLMLPAMGFFDEEFASQPTSETGTYQVALYLVRDGKYRDRMIGSGNFRIEEFQPDTLKIESRLLDVPSKGWSTASALTAEVHLRNLFGTAAQQRKVTGRLQVTPARFSFRDYQGFVFTDPYYDPEQAALSVNEPLDSLTTDNDGVARFELPLQRFARGTYQLTLTVEGFEPGGGRSVTAQNRTLISPCTTLLGYKSDGALNYIHKDKPRSLELIALNSELTPVAADHLQVRLITVETLSTLVKQPNGTFKYQSVKREKPGEATALTLQAGAQSYPLPTATPGDYILEIVDDAGLKLARVPFTVVGHGNLTGELERNAELKLALDRKDYRAGDTIEMSITAPYRGAGLITIESDRVHAFKWFKADATSTLQRITIPKDLEGNAYVNVAFVRDAASKEIFTSPLSYAVQPFTIDRSRRELQVAVTVPQLARPGKALPVAVTVSKPSRLVVFAVDEGILQVAGYTTPQPLDHFLKKRALEVETLQILDLILPEFALVKEVSASGGGFAAERMKALAANLNPFTRQVEKAAVFWSGIVDAGPDATTVNFDLPDSFSGNLRVMAVAVSEQALGVAQQDTVVRGPFVLTPSVLTQAAPGDTFEVSVGVANVLEGSGDALPVTLSVESVGPLQINGSTTQTLTIDEGSEQVARFQVQAGEQPEAAQLIFTATAGDERSRRRSGISLRPAVPYRTTMHCRSGDAGRIDLPVPRALLTPLAEQKMAASVSPLVLVDGLSHYLDHFPHGCTEQVVSQVFPSIGLLAYPQLVGERDALQQRIDVLISRLRQRQRSDGAFTFWPGSREAAPFPSLYVMHFLLETRQFGFTVPRDMLARGEDYLRQIAYQSTSDLADSRLRAYAIYLLTRMGQVTTNALVDVQTTLDGKKVDWHQDITAAYVAAAYQLLRKQDEAEQLIDGYRLSESKTEDFVTFQSPLTRDAQYLYLLCQHFPQQARQLDGASVLRLIDPLFRGRYNTLSASYTILALGAYSTLTNPQGEDHRIRLLAKETEEQALDVALKPFASADVPLTAHEVLVRSNQRLFALLSQAGFDSTLPTQVVREGLEVQRRMVDDDGNAVTTLQQGQEVTVELTIRALGRARDNIAVIDLLPGGFEVLRDSVPRTAVGWRADYVDVREDRLVFYGRFDTRVRTLSYRAKATAAGNFVVPALYAESMYDRSVHASALPGRVEVVATP